MSGLAIAALLQGSANAVLIHHWEFNGDATDSVGANDGTLNGGATLVASGSGLDQSGYLTVDGASGSFVGTGLFYDPDSTFSWSVWVRAGSDTVGSAMADSPIIEAYSPRKNIVNRIPEYSVR